MAISRARLRMGLVVGAALLVLTIAGFLGYARYRTHRFLAGLPGKLGIDIRRETDGYTISKSVGPNTTMTLHASKAVEHKDGKLTLHDVSMVLYGRKQDRQDRISGAEFEYEQQTGVVRAVGEVHIDLQAPAHGQPAILSSEAGEEDKGIVHVKTSGLIFLQKLGVAATDQELEFRFGGMTGRARGAEYNSDTGMVILQSDVEAHGEEHGAPVTLRASHAELDRPKLLATATDARYSSPTQTARGDKAAVYLRSDSSPERINAEGNVVLGAAGATVTAPHAEMLLSEAGKARSAHLSGGVGYGETTALREAKARGSEARVAFDAKGKARTMAVTGDVQVEERVRVSSTAPWSGRDAVAGRMNLAFDGGVLREVDADDGARVTLRGVSGVTELLGDALRGRFNGGGKAAQLSDLHAAGHTGLRRTLADGAEQTSSGDALDVAMRPGASGKQDGVQTIERATQAGHVVLTSMAARKPGAKTRPNASRATAELAVYEGAADHVTLTGGAEVADDTGKVSAGTIVLNRDSGDATASGAVKATYWQAAAAGREAAEPVHVVADRAELQHDAERAVFNGGNRPARMWQGGSQVEAAVLELDQGERTLTAHGAGTETGSGAGAAVHTALTGAKVGDRDDKSKPASLVRVASRTMVYRDQARRVEFGGGVIVEDADGTARASEAVAFLQPADALKNAPKEAVKDAPKGSPGISLGGGLERIVAKGKVEVDQPGRRALGEQLVYTAEDGLFVLTGTSAAPPRLMDETQGTVTGQTLSFHSDDRSVVVAGGAGQRVRTVTRVKQH